MNSSDYNDITGAPFISEIHYDNAGTDTGEFVEICAPNGTDVSTFTLYLYNGNNGETYNSFDLSTITACDGGDGNDYYVIDLPTNGIQNGAPDGLALVNGGAVCEFLSYEGTFTATNGPASGLTSTDIGVSQTGTTPVGSSLQVNPATGTWESFDDDTPKEQNQCYLKGTNILTDKGEIPIENLSIGDVVIDYRGTPRQIKWIGIQQITPDHNKFYEYQPVKVAAHALEQGVPSSDVSLSPDHAILVDDLLVNIRAI